MNRELISNPVDARAALINHRIFNAAAVVIQGCRNDEPFPRNSPSASRVGN